MYADEYGGYGSGMNTGTFRNSGGGGGRFGNERGIIFYIIYIYYYDP
jgi:hypothetical protein